MYILGIYQYLMLEHTILCLTIIKTIKNYEGAYLDQDCSSLVSLQVLYYKCQFYKFWI